MMNEALVALFLHNRWANERLLEVCAQLDEAQLDASDPGTYGTVAATLTHLAGAEQRYLQRMTDQAPEVAVREADGFPGFDQLRTALRQSGDGLIAVAERAEPGRLVRGLSQGQPAQIRLEHLLVQAINHATEHRTNITTTLAQQGIQAPQLDGWAFALASTEQ
jgi:uncharacterized damage-inducible protein DinB